MQFEQALLCMHGMGNLTENEFRTDIQKVIQNIEERMPEEKFSKIYIPPKGIFYSDLTQKQEDKAHDAMTAIWSAMGTEPGLTTGLIRPFTINRIRQFIISGFSDATAFIGSSGSGRVQQYTHVQQRIYDALDDVYQNCGNVPITIISQSLGGQILSDYLWDAQRYMCIADGDKNLSIDSRSIWACHKEIENDGFLCLQTLNTWFTTGCNIPIFVSGFKDVRAVHNRDYGYQFDWINYFDYDDVLGYPLAPLGALFDQANPDHGQSYANTVTDIQINANEGLSGALLSCWNPFSHTQYWGDRLVMDALASALHHNIPSAT